MLQRDNAFYLGIGTIYIHSMFSESLTESIKDTLSVNNVGLDFRF